MKEEIRTDGRRKRVSEELKEEINGMGFLLGVITGLILSPFICLYYLGKRLINGKD